METIPLNGLWELRDAPGAMEPLPAPVPGSVHDALLAAGRLEDAHLGYGERDQLWVGERTWVYRRKFELSADHLAREHLDLVAEGLDTFCSIRVNGEELARTDNMLRGWRFEAKSLLRCGENEIELIFSPASERMRVGTAGRHLPAWNEYEPHHIWGPVGRGYVRKQACQFGWDWGPQCPSAGPWLPLSLECWSGARIGDWRLEQEHLGDGSVRLSLYTRPTSGDDLLLKASFALGGEELAEVAEPFWGGHEWVFTLGNPALWWPNGMGAQPLHDLSIELRTPAGEILDRRQARIGLRLLELVREPDQFGRSFHFRANGRPFFAKGSNWIPLDAHPSGRDLEPRYRRDLESAAAAHMNMLRVWGGGYFSHEVFYDLCDELGILVWQDLMFGCGTYPTWDEHFLQSVRQETLYQARRLRHHACLACWCGNNELEQGFTAEAWKADDPSQFKVGKMAWASYNELFERVLPSALTEADPTTPYFRGSPHCAPEDGRNAFTDRSGDLHTWEIWFSSAPFENYRHYRHRFVSEFGFQSLPEAATLRACAPEGEVLTAQSQWLAFRQRSQPGNARVLEITADWFGEAACGGDFGRYCLLTQLTQGLGLKIGMEHWRRLFPRCGGATYWQVNDRWAASTWATLDVHGQWKAAHHLVRKTFAPLAVIGVEDARARSLTAYVVNDHPDPVAGEFRLVVTNCAGEELARTTLPLIAPGNSFPTEVGVFALRPGEGGKGEGHGRAESPSCLQVNTPTENLLVWVHFAPDLAARGDVGAPTEADNLVLLARPRALRLERPDLDWELSPGDSPGESWLTVRLLHAVNALCVHLARAETLPPPGGGVWLEEEFFHLPPGSWRRVRLRHPGRPAPAAAELRLLSIADYLLT